MIRFDFNNKARNKLIGIIGIVAVGCSVGGGVTGYYAGTGTFPMVGQEAIVAPYVIPATVTKTEILEFIKTDDTDLIPYEAGFNCVEYAMVLGLKGRWDGIASMLIKVDYANEPFGHILVAYQTSDAGLVFIDPGTDIEVNPRVGSQLAGKTITGLSVLKSEWVSFEVLE